MYLAAIVGLVPLQMVKALRHFVNFCYLARRNILDDKSLQLMDEALQDFHRERDIFISTGVWDGPISLPRQHSMVHYVQKIRKFGAPNGLCTSITESKHIQAVKKPWRRSNRYNVLAQMLIINQRADKLAAARVDFVARGMLHGMCLSTLLIPRDAEMEETPSRFMGIPSSVLNSFVLDGDRLLQTGDDRLAPDADDTLGEGVVDGPTVEGEVFLTANHGTL